MSTAKSAKMIRDSCDIEIALNYEFVNFDQLRRGQTLMISLS